MPRCRTSRPRNSPASSATPGGAADKGLLEVSFAVEDYQNGPDGIPIAVTEENPKTVLVEYSGRFRFSSDGRRWRIEYVGQVVRRVRSSSSPRAGPRASTARRIMISMSAASGPCWATREKTRVNYTPGGLFWPQTHRAHRLAGRSGDEDRAADRGRRPLLRRVEARRQVLRRRGRDLAPAIVPGRREDGEPRGEGRRVPSPAGVAARCQGPLESGADRDRVAAVPVPPGPAAAGLSRSAGWETSPNRRSRRPCFPVRCPSRNGGP